MKPSETPAPAPSYIAHVKDGVVVIDARLPDGRAVRVEPLAPGANTPVDAERDERVRRLQQLFAVWTDEDAKLSDEEADRLQAALEGNRGLNLWSPALD